MNASSDVRVYLNMEPAHRLYENVHVHDRDDASVLSVQVGQVHVHVHGENRAQIAAWLGTLFATAKEGAVRDVDADEDGIDALMKVVGS